MKLKTEYLNLATKRAIVEQIVNNCITYDGDLILVDFIQRDISLTLSLIQFYTNENIEEIDLDEFYSTGRKDELINSLPVSEIEFLKEAIEYAITEKKQTYNSLSGVLSRGIEKLLLKIPDSKEMSKLMKQIPKVMDSLSPENKEIFKSFVEGKIK